MASEANRTRKGRESLSKRLGRVARQIKARDNGRCVYCGRTAEESGTHLQLDHLLPRVDGGADVAENLVVACRDCNGTRKNMSLDAWCTKIGVSAAKIRRQALLPLPAEA